MNYNFMRILILILFITLTVSSCNRSDLLQSNQISEYHDVFSNTSNILKSEGGPASSDMTECSSSSPSITTSQSNNVSASFASSTNSVMNSDNSSEIISKNEQNLTDRTTLTTIYSQPWYMGKSFDITGEKISANDMPHGFENGIGSVHIAENKRLVLYRRDEDGGGFISFDENEPDLTRSGWNKNFIAVAIEEKLAETDETVKEFNYILGTQTFNPLYHFSDENGIYETAKRIYEMGSNTIKMYDKVDYHAILKEFDFRYIYLWMRTDSIRWNDGLSDIESKIEYEAVYDFVENLLTDYNNSRKTFYLGHWEGDWYLISNYNTAQTSIDKDRLQGMIDWLNIRQKAIDDAKRNIPHTNVEVWGYTEANRATDIGSGADRLVNKVLPYVNIDYLSYSAYDIQGLSGEKISSFVKDMASVMKVKSNVPGPRVFIGETGLPAVLTQNDQDVHNTVNIDFFIKYFDAHVGQILFWQMYNNEQSNGTQQGYWLIDNNDVKWKLYYSYKAFYCNAREFVRSYNKTYGEAPDLATFSDWASDFLKTMR